MSVLLYLQRFCVPDPDEKYAKRKWKTVVKEGAYEMAQVKSLAVVAPWNRFCQVILWVEPPGVTANAYQCPCWSYEYTCSTSS